MSSEFPNRSTGSLLHGAVQRARHQWQAQTLGVRLVVGYAALFTASVALLAALAYGLLIYFLQQPDRSFMEDQAHELAAAYERGGAEALRATLEGAASDERRQEILVRLLDGDSRTLLLYNPDNWRPADLDSLRNRPLPDASAWIPLGLAEDGDPLAAYALRLAPDRVLQVGMDADLRADVLDSMQSVFLTTALPVILLALLGGTLLAYRALRPARQLVRTFQDIIETGNVHTRAPADDMRGEFAEMVHLFNRMLARIERLVTGMRDTLDNVAHDLRTPMTRLRGHAELALRHADDADDLRDALADTLEASDAVLETLDAIMDVAEAETGAMQLHRETVPMEELARDVADIYELVADAKDISLSMRVPPDLHVHVDPRRMRQVLANLVDNAIKYTPKDGHVTVRAAGNDGIVCITVEDDGIGIDPEAQPRIWDRLYRADDSRSEQGLGLGLSLVKAIVEAHGGSVRVASTIGDGSTFTVCLPDAAHAEGRTRHA